MCDFILDCEDVYLHIHIFLHLLKSKKNYVIVKRRDQIRILLHRTKRYHIGPRKKEHVLPHKDPARNPHASPLNEEDKGSLFFIQGRVCGRWLGAWHRRALPSSYVKLPRIGVWMTSGYKKNK